MKNKIYSFCKQNKTKFRTISIFFGNGFCFCVKLYKTFFLYSSHFKIILRYLHLEKIRIYNIHNTI